jgi:GTPase
MSHDTEDMRAEAPDSIDGDAPTWYEEPLPPDHRSGFVAVVGRPNVGKSTLMNAYLGQKVAIVSPRPQTTRNRLLGILTQPTMQIVFVDTPGIHAPRHKLGQYLVDTACGAIPDADVVLFTVDLSEPPTAADRTTAGILAERTQAPIILALNKADKTTPAQLQPHVDAYNALGQFADWMLVSATRGDNLDKLLEMIRLQLPAGPRYYPPDQITDQQERFMAAELIREQVLVKTRQEVPHGVAVVIEEFSERRPDLTYIGATIYVERETHKGILIGTRGDMLKQIGRDARNSIEELLGHKVFLELWVKTRQKWRQSERDLRNLGYAIE